MPIKISNPKLSDDSATELIDVQVLTNIATIACGGGTPALVVPSSIMPVIIGHNDKGAQILWILWKSWDPVLEVPLTPVCPGPLAVAEQSSSQPDTGGAYQVIQEVYFLKAVD